MPACVWSPRTFFPPPNEHASLAVLLWSVGLNQPEHVATPFIMAQAAAALDARVELYFSAQSVVLLTPQAGATRVGFGGEQRDLSSYLNDTHAMGVTFWACAQAMHALGLSEKDLISSCSGMGGTVPFMARSLDPTWRTLVF